MSWRLLFAAALLPGGACGDGPQRLRDPSPPLGEIGDGVLEVNVGGEVFQCLRSTLTSVKGSVLESIFSGHWSRNWSKDDHGRVFLDLDADAFRLLLSVLRTRRHSSSPRDVRPPLIPVDLHQAFATMVQYFGLEELFAGTATDASAPPTVPVPPLTLVASGSSAKKEGWLSVEGGLARTGSVVPEFDTVYAESESPLLEPGNNSPCWTITLGERAADLTLGITGKPGSPTLGAAYGWTNGWVWSRGYMVGPSNADEWDNWEAFAAGDVAVINLDAGNEQLRLFLRRTKTVYHLELVRPGAEFLKKARLLLALRGPDVEVTVSPSTEEERAEAGFAGR